MELCLNLCVKLLFLKLRVYVCVCVCMYVCLSMMSSAQTFLLLGAAEAARCFLELIAVNFDHPKGAEDLRQVGGLVTAGEGIMVTINYELPAHHRKTNHPLTTQRGHSST